MLFFQPRTYYVAIAVNFTLRLGWAILISPEQPYVQQNYILVLGCAELVRRVLWAVFRVEWEYITSRRAADSTVSIDNH